MSVNASKTSWSPLATGYLDLPKRNRNTETKPKYRNGLLKIEGKSPIYSYGTAMVSGYVLVFLEIEMHMYIEET